MGRVRVVDSHTEGEPTRVVIDGCPELPPGSLVARRDYLRTHLDWFRTAVCCEPRGSEVVVGALLCPPTDPSCAAAVIFFNDVGYLGMCGHGTIGVLRTLQHLGRLSTGKHRIETPVGVVEAELLQDGSVRVDNVASYRYRSGVKVEVPGLPRLTGEIAWGGNWFFLCSGHGLPLQIGNRDELLRVTRSIRGALADAGITGEGGAPIDHVELFGEPGDPANSSRNFVLCPGASFDRSPCGTGTSAKLACLHAEGRLAEGELWRQEGILGTWFTGSIRVVDGAVLPSIQGRAWITAESTLLFDDDDPFRSGIVF